MSTVDIVAVISGYIISAFMGALIVYSIYELYTIKNKDEILGPICRLIVGFCIIGTWIFNTMDLIVWHNINCLLGK